MAVTKKLEATSLKFDTGIRLHTITMWSSGTEIGKGSKAKGEVRHLDVGGGPTKI
jgi:hypothetical protein